ncbi:hypothetical protein DL764_007207 [Monosporascus ibericus]|uniref:Uncharacterized protein n=1 Tax=Monosporascus ibericus TaxID=155417 RepID=A0A4Q4T4Y5_9PEZI|nr:hypothetical protein DL764_007207 [Monosporascus ibericus]
MAHWGNVANLEDMIRVHLLFGSAVLDKVVDATKQWAEFALLPQPNTQRHLVDALMRRQRPELDMELATTPQQLEERAMCIVYYGTWPSRGHANPEFVHLTPDTRLIMGWTERRLRAELLEEVSPRFKPKRMAVSRPNWATLFVLGINSFTQRQNEQDDIKNGLVCLIPIGGDLFFPQLGVRLEYQPGPRVIFRGREFDHLVGDWKGYRIFVAVTNHQPVRNWVSRRLGKVPALPEIDEDEDDEDAEGEDRYVLCVEPALDPQEPPRGYVGCEGTTRAWRLVTRTRRVVI